MHFTHDYSLHRTSSSESLFKNEQGSNVETEAGAAMCSEKPRKPLFRDTDEANEQREAKTRDYKMPESRENTSHSL